LIHPALVLMVILLWFVNRHLGTARLLKTILRGVVVIAAVQFRISRARASRAGRNLFQELDESKSPRWQRDLERLVRKRFNAGRR
jgi:hypothetical protein